MSERDPLVGMWILDQYRLVRRLGRGGMGRVYLAEQPSMGRWAAIKLLPTAEAVRAETLDRFRREARAISRLSHPNIVTVYNCGALDDGSPFMAMEYAEGVCLTELLKQQRLPVVRSLDLVLQCAGALGYAHAQQIVHRDFKPDNVMVTRLQGRDHVKILDFGIALFLEETGVTQPGTLLGTAEYLSPEHCRGERGTAFSDQYSLGLVFYQLLTGRLPLEAETVMGYLHLHQHVMPEPPSSIRPAAEVELLDPIVLRMVAKSPGKRFPDMADVVAAVRDALSRIDRLGPGAAREAEALSHPGGAGDEPRPVPMQLAPSPVPERARPAPLRVLTMGDEGLSREWRDALCRNGIDVVAECREAAELSLIDGALALDACVLITSAAHLEADLRDWQNVGLLQQETLVCVDQSIESLGLVGLAGSARNLWIGPRPPDAQAMALALRWMSGQRGSVLEHLSPEHAVGVLQIGSSERKSKCLSALLADLLAKGVRRPAQQAVREIGDEMITNALSHAPRNKAGAEQPVMEATLRWVVGGELVGLSVRDAFGTLTGKEVLDFVSGPTARPRPSPNGSGAGLGLRIISRAAEHLFFFIEPGQSCEAVALVAREQQSRSAEGRSVCVLEAGPAQRTRIGSRLACIPVVTDGVCLHHLRGEIDETSDLDAVFGGAGVVRLDLSGVSSVNSKGILVWLKACRAAPSTERLYCRCSPAVVRQFSMLPTLAASGRVVSVIAPYLCPHCEHEWMEELAVEEIIESRPPARRCAYCQRELQFEEMAERYFPFLTTSAAVD